MFLLDTNICIYIIKNNPVQAVQRIEALEPGQVKLSSVALAELEYGVSKSRRKEKNRTALLHFVSAFEIVSFDENDAAIFGLIRADLEKKGQVIGPYDMQMAAQAITRNLILVTSNTHEFSRIPLLKLDNWV
jgi:tRNA(fMet)-specific endonuclease VapC